LRAVLVYLRFINQILLRRVILVAKRLVKIGGTNMMYASDFRRTAREALSGKWVIAVIVGLIATLLGGSADSGGIKLNFDVSGLDLSFEYAGRTIFTTSGIAPELSAIIAGGIAYMVLTALIMAVLFFLLGSVISIGYSRFNLELVDEGEPAIENLFAYFRHWQTAAAARILQAVYVLLWSLLLVIPGIMATYSYAMTGYILAENPELTASEAISMSKEMMRGNRWRLFCLHFSFIGWGFLASLTMGIGNLFLIPYREAANAAFYREVSGTQRPLNDPWDTKY